MLRTLITCAVLATATLAGADSKSSVTITDKTIELASPIYFETAKPVIKQESFATLDALAAAIKADKHLAMIEIQAHTDERGDNKWNLEISQHRADAILQALVDRGVDAKRLRATGYGETRPLDKHHNAAAWAKNRRIALVILQRIT